MLLINKCLYFILLLIIILIFLYTHFNYFNIFSLKLNNHLNNNITLEYLINKTFNNETVNIINLHNYEKIYCFYTMNTNNYDPIVPPPDLIAQFFYTIYLTDNNSSADKALKLGWNEVYIFKNDAFTLNSTDNSYSNSYGMRLRFSAIYLSLFPNIIPSLAKCQYIFRTDSNVVKVGPEYMRWVKSFRPNHALILMLGHYSGLRDDIETELKNSIQNR
jgi:hypothetical protein